MSNEEIARTVAYQAGAVFVLELLDRELKKQKANA